MEETNSRTYVARHGVMLLLSSPSGAGKSTLANRLLQLDDKMQMSVSLTTRPPRPGEVDGKDYFFVSHEEFEQMKAEEALLEWAEVFGNFYGTPKAPVETQINHGRDVLFDVDWQGAQQIYKQTGDQLVRVFILPPSKEILHDRLRSRAQDKPEVIEKRMAAAAREMSHWNEYDYVLINDNLDVAFEELKAILLAERKKRIRQTGLAGFVAPMLG